MDTGLLVRGETAADVWSRALSHLITRRSAGPKGTVGETLGATLVIDKPSMTLMSTNQRKFNYAYMLMESIWNLTDTYEIDVLRRYAKVVDQFVADQPEGDRDIATWAYGPQLNEQFKYIANDLYANPGSRRASMAIDTNAWFRADKPRHIGSGTPPCLVAVQFQVRDGELAQHVFMRSNDIWLGTPLDIFQFAFWGQMLAAFLRVRFAKYTHHVGSLHLYQRDYEAAVNLVSDAALYMRPSNIQAWESPKPGQSALLQVLNGDAYNAIKKGKTGNKVPGGIDAHVAFMLGDYEHAPAMYNMLRAHGHGIAWPKQK